MTAPPAIRTLLLLACASLLAIPGAAADRGSEVKDTVDDGGLDQLDIQGLWIDTNDTQNLTFHLTLGAELPPKPAATSRCDADGCTYTALTYRVVFRVLASDGAPGPAAAGYNRSYVAYRHGPDGDLASPVGYFGADDVLVYTGTANITLDKTQLTLRIPRNDTAIGMPAGPTPGTIIDRVYAYDSPQLCDPDVCYALDKPGVDPDAGPSAALVTSSAQWDRAPDAGYANATYFPAPPAPASASAGPTPAATPTPTPKAPIPAAPSPASVAGEDGPIASGSGTSTAPVDGKGKQSPGLAAPLLLAGLAALAVAARRRL